MELSTPNLEGQNISSQVDIAEVDSGKSEYQKEYEEFVHAGIAAMRHLKVDNLFSDKMSNFIYQ